MAMEYLIGNRARKLRRRERESNKTRLSSIFRLYIYIYFWLSGLRCQLEIGAVSEVARLLTRSLTHHFVNWVFLFYLRRRCAFWVPQCMAVTMCFFVHPLYRYIYIYISIMIAKIFTVLMDILRNSQSERVAALMEASSNNTTF